MANSSSINGHPTPAAETGAGMGRRHFTKICANGFGDGNNSYAHSMAWFRGQVYVGTSRATMALIKGGMTDIQLEFWPVEMRNPVYSREFELEQARAEIWRYTPETGVWQRVHQAPMV